MKRKLIGVILSDATADYPRNILKGIMEQAKVYNYNVAVFSTFVRLEGSVLHQIGEISIFQLINYEKFDGFIILPDSIYLNDSLLEIQKTLRERCKCPVVCADMTEEFGERIPTDEEHDFNQVVNHFIKVHKFTKIACLTGTKGTIQAESRLSGYKKALIEHNIPIDENLIMYGDFWIESGKEFVEHILKDKENIPEAIVCGNDLMAITVCDALKEKGYTVPEDICISGYDNTKMGMLNCPTITTLKTPQKRNGSRCVEYIYNYLNGIEINKDVIYGQLILGESCGCCSKSNYGSLSKIQRRNYQTIINGMRDKSTELNLMRETLIGVNNIEELIKRLHEKIYLIKNYKDFYLCLNSDWEGSKEIEVSSTTIKRERKPLSKPYTNHMKLMIKHRDREYVHVYNEEFQVEDMLPDLWKDELESQTYYFLPIHFEDRTYGYTAVTFDEVGQAYDYDLRNWISNVSSSLEILRTKNNLKWYHQQLESLAIRDSLTGVFNRRGLEKYTRDIFEESKREGKYFTLLVADLDELKSINDNYGHQEGDNALLLVTEAFLKLPKELGVFARTGGDEFVYIFKKEHKKDSIMKLIKEVQENLIRISRENAPYPVTVSIGVYYGIPKEDMSISDCHSLADKNMYYEKVKKKGMF